MASQQHWPSERSTQHSEDLLPVHFLLSSGCDDSKLLRYGSHWVIGCDTPIYLWEREKEPIQMKTKWLSRHLSSVSGSLIFTQLRVIDYIQDKNTDWVQKHSVLLLSGAQCWETVIVLHSSALERQMREINDRLPLALHGDARVEVVLNYRGVIFLLATV